jgi:hypothetical protein
MLMSLTTRCAGLSGLPRAGFDANDLWRSYQANEAALTTSPESREVRLRCADSLCRWMRVSTDGNTVTIAGPGDSPERRKLWAAHAPRAVELYRGLLDTRSSTGDPDPAVLSNYIECVSYASSAKGIALAALSGDAAVFLSNVGRLQSLCPAHGNGLPYIFTAAFYLAAPFPVRSAKRALAAARAAVAVGPKSRRNLYYAGLAALGTKDRAVASSYFAAALDPSATADSESERDIAAVFERESRRGLEACT